MINKIIEINTILLSLTGLSLLGILIKFYKYIKYKKEKDKNVNKALLSIIKDKLFHNLKECIKKNYITINELKNIETLFNSYQKLGGNSFISELYTLVKKLPIKEDKDGRP